MVCVAYIPEWELLANALMRVKAFSGNEQQAQIDICNALADRKIAVRVFDGDETYLGGNVRVPRRLTSSDFDWVLSKPIKPWFIGPMPGQHYYWNGGDRPISLIELSTADVRDVLCNAEIPTNTRNAGRKPTKLEQTKTAMRHDIKTEKLTPDRLKEMLQKNLAERYGVSRETACKAREEVLSEINSPH